MFEYEASADVLTRDCSFYTDNGKSSEVVRKLESVLMRLLISLKRLLSMSSLLRSCNAQYSLMGSNETVLLISTVSSFLAGFDKVFVLTKTQ